MVKIYEAGPADGCEWVHLHKHDDREYLLTLSEEPIAEGFQPLSAYRILEDEGEIFTEADMPWMMDHWLVMRDHVRKELEPVMSGDVEFLPLITDDGLRLWITHALNNLPVLDLERSEIKRFPSSGRIMRIVRHHFLPQVEQAEVAFHLEEMKRGSLYVTGKVVDAVHRAGFTGTKFTEIWDTEKT